MCGLTLNFLEEVIPLEARSHELPLLQITGGEEGFTVSSSGNQLSPRAELLYIEHGAYSDA